MNFVLMRKKLNTRQPTLHARGYKVTNWRAYNRSLKHRDSITLWFPDDAIASWHRKRSLAETTMFKY